MPCLHSGKPRHISINTRIFRGRIWAEWDRKGVFGGEEEGGSVRGGPGAARTVLLFHIIGARPSKHPLIVLTFLKVYMALGSYSLFLQEQIKDIIIIIRRASRRPGPLDSGLAA
jgi:hypothetical protein